MREIEREIERFHLKREKERESRRFYMNILCLLSIDCLGLLLYGKSNNYQIRNLLTQLRMSYSFINHCLLSQVSY